MNKNLWVYLLGALLCVSCDQSAIFDTYYTIDEKGWHAKEAQSFRLTDLDTAQSYNLFINIRNNNSYPFSNLFLITKIDFPNGKTQVDTLEYLMANPKGDWLGTGAASVKESKLWFKEAYQFDEIGDYQVSVRHAMRKNGVVEGVQYLKGITNVGLRVENIQH